LNAIVIVLPSPANPLTIADFHEPSAQAKAGVISTPSQETSTSLEVDLSL